jgi:hypothetical protein
MSKFVQKEHIGDIKKEAGRLSYLDIIDYQPKNRQHNLKQCLSSSRIHNKM